MATPTGAALVGAVFLSAAAPFLPTHPAAFAEGDRVPVALSTGTGLAAQESAPPPARLAPTSLGIEHSEQESFAVRVIAQGLRVPWSIAVIAPDEFLVTERAAGRLAHINLWTRRLTYVEGLPPIQLGGDAGLRDVVLAPDFDESGQLYFSYSSPEEGGGSALAVDRARLDGGVLTERERLYTARPASDSLGHYGGRILLRDGALFVTSGDRLERAHARALTDPRGKVLRIATDGSPPAGNPFLGRSDALPEVWSVGHRNAQGIAVHPETGSLWIHEHGPAGGDEINLVRPGADYGWPLVSYGREYSGERINGGRTSAAGVVEPIWYFVPSIAPSGLAFYQGDAFPGWRGDAFLGALAGRHLLRLDVDGDRVIHTEPLLADRGWRVRVVAPSPDGSLLIGVDGGNAGGMLLRIVPPESEDM